jgi:hypothetical protein
MPDINILCRRHGRRALFSLCAVLALAGLAACATHRSDPPQCKGPFTPINQSSSVASNGPQR